MRSLALRALAGLAVAVGLVLSAAPAAAADVSTFRLVSGSVVGNGTYEVVSGQSAAPIRIAGTLAGRSPSGCAVVQVAHSGPADGVEWQTFGRHCGRGRSAFRVRPSYLFRGVKPAVRLCSGRTLPEAERGRQCDLYQPSTER
jgi:hypothetical protein